MQALDLEVAGDFIVVAAELCQIKAKMLLPCENEPKKESKRKIRRVDLVRRRSIPPFQGNEPGLGTLSEEARKLYYRGTSKPMTMMS